MIALSRLIILQRPPLRTLIILIVITHPSAIQILILIILTDTMPIIIRKNVVLSAVRMVLRDKHPLQISSHSEAVHVFLFSVAAEDIVILEQIVDQPVADCFVHRVLIARAFSVRVLKRLVVLAVIDLQASFQV